MRASPLIRLARQGDLDSICRIEDESFSDPYPRELLARLLRDCSKDFLVAVIEQGALVGYCVASIEGKLAHLISIAVAREYRRQGVGAALMAASIENLGARTAELGLEVKEGNVEAIRLYAKFGFRTLNLIRNYYADGSSAVKMRLTLPAAKQVESGGAG